MHYNTCTESNMQITHEEARRLIQFKADASLNHNSDRNLSAHLQTCPACRTYAESLRETETVLRQSLRRRLDLRPLPPRMDAIYGKTSLKNSLHTIMTTRKALLGIFVMMFAFIAWRSISPNHTPFVQPPSSTIPAIPAPSTFTATNTRQDACREVNYVVQDGDTLNGIARQFSITTDSIRLVNQLTEDTLFPGRELVLSLCEATPAGTLNAPTFTITPATQIVITTPG